MAFKKDFGAGPVDAGTIYDYKRDGNGWVKFTSGFIIIWGVKDCDSGTNHQIDFPDGANPTKLVSILCGPVNADDGTYTPNFGDLSGCPIVSIDKTSATTAGHGNNPTYFKINTKETTSETVANDEPIGRVNYIAFGMHTVPAM